MIIRPAQAGDEREIAKVHLQAWQEAYKGLMPQDFLDGLPGRLEGRTKMWIEILSNPIKWTWVAESVDGIVGFCSFGQPRDPNREGFIELESIYLVAAEKGKGIGFDLLKMGFNEMKNLNYKKAYCWVLERNPTIEFYEKSGAKFSGLIKEGQVGGIKIRELAYDWYSLDLT